MNIEIRIPDNLTKEQEFVLIAKKLASKSLQNKTKLLSNGKNDFDIIEKEDNIKIIRYTKEKKYETLECSICNCLYQKSKGKAFFHNYGGIVKRKTTCSLQCTETYVSLLGQRASIKRSGLRTLFF